MTSFVEWLENNLFTTIILNGDKLGLTVGVYIKKNYLILRLKGELDDVTVSDLRMKISKYLDEYNIKHLIINVKELSFLDSSGIGFIIGRYHQLRRNAGDISIVCMNPKVERIILLSGLTKICMIRENEDVCINAWGGY